MALVEIKKNLLERSEEAVVKFLPVPCGDQRVTYMFKTGIEALRFVTVPASEIVRRSKGLDLSCDIELKIHGVWKTAAPRHVVRIFVKVEPYCGGQAAVGQEREIASIHVQLHPGGRGHVVALQTACGLELASEGKSWLEFKTREQLTELTEVSGNAEEVHSAPEFVAQHSAGVQDGRETEPSRVNLAVNVGSDQPEDNAREREATRGCRCAVM